MSKSSARTELYNECKLYGLKNYSKLNNIQLTDLLATHKAKQKQEEPKNKLGKIRIRKVNKKLSPNKEPEKELDEEETEETSFTKPIIKWVGGKTQIINQVLNQFPKEITNYHELFIGGASVLIALLESVESGKIKLSGKCYAYDLNPILINLYKNIQSSPEKIIEEITPLINKYNGLKDDITLQKAYYLELRQKFNTMGLTEKSLPVGSAHFIFLNKTCFRGLYREGPNGFNVPFGNYSSPEIINSEHLTKISKLFAPVVFTQSDFATSFKNIKPDDFVYLDPPYAPESETSFVGYTTGGFDLTQHKLLFDTCKAHKFLMSNSAVSLVTENFPAPQYTTTIIECKRSINAKNPGSKTNEVLIKSYKFTKSY